MPTYFKSRFYAVGVGVLISTAVVDAPAFAWAKQGAGKGDPPKPKAGSPAKPPKPPTKTNTPPPPTPVAGSGSAPKSAPVPPPVAPTPPRASVSALLDINDLGLLRALLPLQLTAEQIVSIRETVVKVERGGDTRRKADDATFQPLLADLSKARADALQDGTDPPADLEERVKAAAKEMDTRLETARTQALADFLTTLRATLTSAQKNIIETQSEKFYGGKRVPPQYKSKPTDAPKEVVQDLAMLFYIERVLLNERIDLVLGKMRPAAPTPVPAP